MIDYTTGKILYIHKHAIQPQQHLQFSTHQTPQALNLTDEVYLRGVVGSKGGGVDDLDDLDDPELS